VDTDDLSCTADVLHNRVREVPDKAIWKREGLKQCSLPVGLRIADNFHQENKLLTLINTNLFASKKL
jgi:hypothetical protein